MKAQGMKKSKLPFFAAFRLGTRDLLRRPVRLAALIFLAATALMLFGLSVTVALYREDSAKAQSMVDFDHATVILFSQNGEPDPISAERLREIESGAGKGFGTLVSGNYLDDWMDFSDASALFTGGEPQVSDLMTGNPQSVCYVKEEILKEAGFRVWGRLPQEEYEIAINRCMLEYFRRTCYYDNLASPAKIDELTGQLVFDETQKYAVNGANDIIGKRLQLKNLNGSGKCEATVVGVVDYDCCIVQHALGEEAFGASFYDQIFVSESYACAAMRANYGTEALGEFAVAGAPHSASEAEKILSFCQKDNSYLLASQSVLAVEEYRDAIRGITGAFVGVGAVLAVFAGMLIFQFINLSIESKKMQIGILRALGARPSDVYKIFFSESLLLALIYAAIAVPFTYGMMKVVNLVLNNLFSVAVSVMTFHIWMPISIFAISIGISLAATFFPVWRTARLSPVQSIARSA